MITGTCLCRQVAFSIHGPVIEMGNCHCTECRKAYGSAFGTIAVCRKEQFQYTMNGHRNQTQGKGKMLFPQRNNPAAKDMKGPL